ncbi:deubiquitinase OTUD6B [Trichonephila inaurata madagascariensis]|uniref:Deubiquitinase OTUD6B n=1 Tax=Trichonephila inaurata madagascariensis TaxID=2747483 RepID=A0A8X7C9G4_9ARAC|nr:deubiquitinase OTUD6B [Trichonephila inaurata madagascariensis]
MTQKMKHSVPKSNRKKKKEITSKIAQMFADLDLKHEEQLKEFEGKNSSTNPSLPDDIPKTISPISQASNLNLESGKDPEQNSPTDNLADMSTSTQAENYTANPLGAGSEQENISPVSGACGPEPVKECKQRRPTRQEIQLLLVKHANSPDRFYIRRGLFPLRPPSPESGKGSEQNSPTDNSNDYNPLHARTDEEFIDGIPREIFPITLASSPDSGKDSMKNSPPASLFDLPSCSAQVEKSPPMIDILDDWNYNPGSFYKPVRDRQDSESDKDTEQNSSGNPNDLPSASSRKLTKAQKRRNKKSQKQKEREKAIAEQDAINLFGCREIENTTILKKLAERQLSLFEIPSDGNCLYSAIQHQLAVLKIQNITAKDLRQLTATYLLTHREDFIPFLVDPDTGNNMTSEQYEKYCKDIVDANTWGGHIEVSALSKIFGKPIEIIQADRDITIGDESASPKLIISYHKSLYGLGAHYNSVVPAKISV